MRASRPNIRRFMGVVAYRDDPAALSAWKAANASPVFGRRQLRELSCLRPLSHLQTSRRHEPKARWSGRATTTAEPKTRTGRSSLTPDSRVDRGVQWIVSFVDAAVNKKYSW